MDRREELNEIFVEALGSRNVYYQPPENLLMEYDAIRYSQTTPRVRYADNAKYSKMKCYDGMVISREPDPEVVDKLDALSYCSFSKPYTAENLYHYPFTIYY